MASHPKSKDIADILRDPANPRKVVRFIYSTTRKELHAWNGGAETHNGALIALRREKREFDLYGMIRFPQGLKITDPYDQILTLDEMPSVGSTIVNRSTVTALVRSLKQMGVKYDADKLASSLEIMDIGMSKKITQGDIYLWITRA